ncbi:MAG: phosphoglycerate dehydrogenase [Actinobacteria bacterium]|nr:phosphoglycerate dehydrogenase [Actinomycetota bacterium]MCL6105121.1 phosphoglycerate dehydrogenase [Actinomycetota bacterium]
MVHTSAKTSKILVTEKLSASGIELMQKGGHEVDIRLSMSNEQLMEAVKKINALVIRSSTKVTKEVIDCADALVVIGRAGVGLDNVDIKAATAKGIMVVNAPESNILSAAEHAMALMLALARNIPQAHSSLLQGEWERSKWEGVELFEKTLGIVGLGKVGTLVGKRAMSFGMKIVAYDPYITAAKSSKLGIELMDLGDLMALSDFVTIHLPKTPETINIINADLLAASKRGIRIINTARGGLIDEVALCDCLRSGQVGGAGLDVFETEPCVDSPLFKFPNVIVTPHLGASTKEAQDKAGIDIAKQILLALKGDFVPFAVNVAATGLEEPLKPFLPLAEQIGRLFGSLYEGVPDKLEIEYAGELKNFDTKILTLAVLKGLFAISTQEPVSYVNAPQLAKELGVEIKEATTDTARDYVNLITLRAPNHCLAGTLTGLQSEPRIVMLDDHRIEVPPAQNMLVVRNDDSPGMIGLVGTVLGNAGISISSMAVGPSSSGKTALMVLSTNKPVSAKILSQLESAKGILQVHSLRLS